MGEIIDIWNKVPHMKGEATCLVCKHKWVAVMQVGCFWAECPQCHCFRGVLRHHICLADGQARLICEKCECQVFQVGLEKLLCLGCGTCLPFPDQLPDSRA